LFGSAVEAFRGKEILMGAWGTAAWDNDDAADWFGDLFATTKLAARVEKALQEEDVEEYAGKIRAAAFVLVALGRVYIWPIDDLHRHLRLAIEKLEAISKLEDYEGDKSIAAEIAELQSRLPPPAPPAKAKTPAAPKATGKAPKRNKKRG
jgi:hypothetical protein